jgi:hypothetical protein
VTTSGRKLILWEHLANPHEHQDSLFRSDELHPAKPYSSMTAGVIGEDDLVRRQRYPEAVRKEHERARWAVSDNWKRRDPVVLPEDRRRRREVDEERNVVHSALESTCVRSVARHGRIDEQRPGVDAAPQVVEIPESLMPKVLSGVLAAYAVVAMEHDRGIPITEEQRIVIRLVEQARAVDRGYCTLLFGADVDQLEGGAALEQGLQLRRRQLTNRRRLVCRTVIAQQSSIVVRQISFGQIRHG